MKLSHIGIIVKDIEEGIKNHETLFGYKQLGPIVNDIEQKVRVVLMGISENDPVKIELISIIYVILSLTLRKRSRKLERVEPLLSPNPLKHHSLTIGKSVSYSLRTTTSLSLLRVNIRHGFHF
jgi:hypothetical protein